MVWTLDAAGTAHPGIAVTGKFAVTVSSIPAQLLSVSKPHTQVPYWMLQPEVMPAVPLLKSWLKLRSSTPFPGGTAKGRLPGRRKAPERRGGDILFPPPTHPTPPPPGQHTAPTETTGRGRGLV